VLLFALSGGLLSLIQAPLGWSLLAWVAYVPFVLACRPDARAGRLALTAFGVGFFYWFGNLYWIGPITIPGWIALGVYMGVVWPLLAMAVRFCRSRRVPLFLAVPVLVVGAEQAQGFPLGGFFWRFLGHSQYNHLIMMQIADLVGAEGVSFVLAMVNGFLADVALQRRRSCPARDRASGKIIAFGGVVTLAVVVGSALYGRWRLVQSAACITDGPVAAALQSNVPISVKRSYQASEEIFEELLEKSRRAATAGAVLIVWPETMVQGFLQPELWPRLSPEPEQAMRFHQALSEHATGTAHLLVGAYGGEVMTGYDGAPRLGTFNSAYLYHPDGTLATRPTEGGRTVTKRYDKIHLVLIGEYLPFRHGLGWLYHRLSRLAPENYRNLDYSLEPGTEYTTFAMTDPNDPNESRPFGVFICYEATVPYVPRNLTVDADGRKRVEWLINISNDGWFVRFLEDPPRVVPSTELPQHAAICAFRAVENRVAILRSVNTGVSCLIDSTGRIRDGYLAASDGFPVDALARGGIAGWFVDCLPIDKRVTFYSRHGQWLATGSSALFVLAFAWPITIALMHRRGRKRNASPQEAEEDIKR
jgi:apolipoprotein N-acyltransferase